MKTITRNRKYSNTKCFGIVDEIQVHIVRVSCHKDVTTELFVECSDHVNKLRVK